MCVLSIQETKDLWKRAEIIVIFSENNALKWKGWGGLEQPEQQVLVLR